MPITNLQFINYSDGQSQLISKTNHNFDEIVESHGGSIGTIGPTGGQGPIGDKGPLGIPGITGPNGSRWFVSPTSTPPLGPPEYPIEGDYWINDAGDINIMGINGWQLTGYNVSVSGSLFNLEDAFLIKGGTTSAIYMSQTFPEKYVFVVADKVPQANVLDETLSKFEISTDTASDSDYLLEFSKTNLEDGSPSDYSKHPYFKWASNLASDNKLVFQIPGGSFFVGASGGFSSVSSNLSISSGNDMLINYGIDSSSGIYSTGGFSFSYPYGYSEIDGSVVSIAGGSGSISTTFNITGNIAGSQSINISSGGTSGILSSRTGDNFSSLSHGIYNLSLETLGGGSPTFYLNTKGKLKTRKVQSGITYSPQSLPGATGVSGPVNINWYFISRTNTSVASNPLNNGNLIVIDPGNSSSATGIGIYSDPLYSWTGNGGIQPGQSIDISVIISPSLAPSGNNPYIKYIGYGTTGGGFTPAVVLDSTNGWATCVDLNLTRGPGGTVVNYKAYGATKGKGGSFII